MASSTGFECVFDLALQTASRRYTHKKFWNVFTHMVTDWISAWALLSLGSFVIPFWIQALLIIIYIGIAIIQHPLYGSVYSVCYLCMAYHALFVRTDAVFLNIFLLLCASVGIQIALGHFWFEKDFSRVNFMGDELLFLVMGVVIDIVYAPFHFSVIFLIRIDFLPEFKSKSDTELRKLMDRMQEKNFSKKTP